MQPPQIRAPKIVSHEEWLEARKRHLRREKELTRARDALVAERRKLPWVRVVKSYSFEGPRGRETLSDLFDGRSQLIVQHFMLAPGWEEGCVGCSFGADHIGGMLPHLEHHDVTYVAVSRAPLPQIEAFKRRMGWGFKWVSSYGGDFNYDFHVSFAEDEIAKGKVYYNYETQDFMCEELPGLSVFYKDPAGEIFHTYSCYARGTEGLLGTYQLLDLTPKGRDETATGSLMDWVKHHDKYDAKPDGHTAEAEESCCRRDTVRT